MQDNNQNVATIVPAHQKKGYLGSLVWWSIAEGRVNRQTLIDTFARNNLPSQLLPNEISANRAFKRALNKMQKASSSGEKYRGIIITKTGEDNTRTVFEIHERSVDNLNNATEFNLADRIVFNKSAGAIDFGVGRYTDIIREFLADCQENYTSNDIRSIVSELVQNHLKAFSARERGAVYFVPRGSEQIIENIRKFIAETVGGGLEDFPVFEEKKRNLGNLCVAEMSAEMDVLCEDVQKAITEGKQGRVFVNRMNAVKEFRKKIVGYSELLDIKAEELLAKAKEAEEKLDGFVKAFANY